MTTNEEYIQKAFIMFYKVMDAVHDWNDGEFKDDILKLNCKHLLENLDRALVQVNEETEGENNGLD